MADVESTDLDYIVNSLMPQMVSTRNRRLTVENEWLLNYRAWQGWPSQNYQLPLPDNAIHYFIPFARRVIEHNVTNVAKLLMPNTDWHSTLPFDDKSHINASNVHNAMRYINEEYLDTDSNVRSAARCFQMYGFSALHTSVMIYDKEVWPYQEIVDPFSFYIFPETAHDASRAQLIFKDFIIPYQVYQAYSKTQGNAKSVYKDIDINDLQAPSWPYHLIERLAYRGLTSPSDWQNGTGNVRRLSEVELRDKLSTNREKANDYLSKQADAFVSLSHVYFRRDSRWFYTVLCTNVKQSGKYNTQVVRLDQEEFTPRYRWAVARPLPGELYTNSKTDDIRVLQNLSNNAISDTEANRQQVQTNPMGVDSSMIGRLDTKVYGNREFWLIPGKPSDAFFPIPVQDVTANGTRMWQIYIALMDKHSGGTLAEGQPGRNMPRAGFATQDLMDMAMVEVVDDARILEKRLFGPGLADIYHTILEYVPNNQLIRIPNTDPTKIKAFRKVDLSGDYHFRWLGALGTSDAGDRADKFMQFAQFLFNPQLLPLLQQQLQAEGLKLDIKGILSTIYLYGLSERGLTDLFIPMTEQEKQAAANPPPSPEQQRVQAQQQAQQQKMAMQQQMHQQKMQGEQQKQAMQLQVEQAKAQADMMNIKGNLQLKQAEGQNKVIDIHAKRAQAMNNLLKPMGQPMNPSVRGTNNG